MRDLFSNLKQRLILSMAKRLPECRNVTRLISQSIDRSMTWREKIVMRLHLLACDACTNYLSNVRFLDRVFRQQGKQLAEGQLFNQLSPEARGRIKKVLISSSTQKN